MKTFSEQFRAKEDSLTKEKSQLEIELRALNEQVTLLKSTNDQLQESMAHNERVIKRLQTEKEADKKSMQTKYESQITELISSKKQVENRLKKSREYIVDLKEKVKDEMKKVKMALDDRDATLHKLESDFSVLRSNMARVSPISVQLLSEYSLIEEQLDNTEELLNGQAKNIAEDYELILREFSALKTRHSDLISELKEKELKIKDLKKEMDETRKIKAETESQVSTLRIQYKSLQEKMNLVIDDLKKEKDTKLALAESKERALQERCESLRNEVEQLYSRCEILRRQKNDLSKERDEAIRQLNMLKKSSIQHDSILF
jgi:chromosome segregation ATPase